MNPWKQLVRFWHDPTKVVQIGSEDTYIHVKWLYVAMVGFVVALSTFMLSTRLFTAVMYAVGFFLTFYAVYLAYGEVMNLWARFAYKRGWTGVHFDRAEAPNWRKALSWLWARLQPTLSWFWARLPKTKKDSSTSITRSDAEDSTTE